MESNDRTWILERHPLLAQSKYIVTPHVQEFCKQIRSVISLRMLGVCYYGPTGIGKSKAMEILKDYLISAYPNMEVVSHNMLNKQVPSIRAFFKHFLRSINAKVQSGETYDLRHRLSNYIIDRGLRSDMGVVVLLIDEAQAMEIDDFNFLKDICNEANASCVQVVTILMAQEPQFDTVVSELRDERRGDLITRFVIDRREFPAFLILEHIESIFEELDKLRYPVANGPVWTEAFFPVGFAHGFRMKAQAKRCFSVIRRYIKPATDEQYRLPLRQFFAALRIFMTANSRYDEEQPNIPDDAWASAFSKALVNDASIIVNAAIARRAGRRKR